MSARITAQGRKIMMEPVESATGITLGGAIAEAQNADTAQEIARRCDCFDEMLEALSWFINDIDGTHTVMVEFDKNVEKARAAIAKATGRAA